MFRQFRRLRRLDLGAYGTSGESTRENGFPGPAVALEGPDTASHSMMIDSHDVLAKIHEFYMLTVKQVRVH